MQVPSYLGLTFAKSGYQPPTVFSALPLVVWESRGENIPTAIKGERCRLIL